MTHNDYYGHYGYFQYRINTLSKTQIFVCIYFPYIDVITFTSRSYTLLETITLEYVIQKQKEFPGDTEDYLILQKPIRRDAHPLLKLTSTPSGHARLFAPLEHISI